MTNASSVPMLTSSPSAPIGREPGGERHDDAGDDARDMRGPELRVNLLRERRQQAVAGHRVEDARLRHHQHDHHRAQPRNRANLDEHGHHPEQARFHPTPLRPRESPPPSAPAIPASRDTGRDPPSRRRRGCRGSCRPRATRGCRSACPSAGSWLPAPRPRPRRTRCRRRRSRRRRAGRRSIHILRTSRCSAG